MKRVSFFNVAVILVLMAAMLPFQAVAAQPAAVAAQNYVPGEVLVGFDGPAGNRAEAAAGLVGASVARQVGSLALLSTGESADIPALVAALNASGQVAFAQPNYIYSIPEAQALAPAGVVTTAGYTISTRGTALTISWEQALALRTVRKHRIQSTLPGELAGNWAWDAVQADLIWSDTKASPSVCVIDTGVELTHPDLSGKVAYGPDFVNNDTISADDNGHGTHVAGILVAKANNGNGTAIGVSNGKVVAVKALNADGVGTSLNLAAAINYCNGNSAVKVINLSLGSYSKGTAEYAAVKKAVTNGKLVVAAAGNDGVSTPFFPAAWADPDITAPDGSANSVSGGVISVGAGGAVGGTPVWVDRNGDGLFDETGDPMDNEIFPAEQCATAFSNYGKWVQMVAPGESVFSTTPSLTPFTLNLFHGVPAKYASLSGTSMSAAFVAGAAARTWSLAGMGNAANVKERLLQGSSLGFGSDLNTDLGFDPARGYNDGEFFYGELYTTEDNREVMKAPYCWPVENTTDGGLFGAAQDMSGASYVNVARAMSRTGMVMQVTDAVSGLPLDNASIRAVINGAVKDTVVLKAGATNQKYPLALLINLPMNFDTGETVSLLVSRTGYTSSYQKVNQVDVYPEDIGKQIFDPYSNVGIPPANANLHVVLNWDALSTANLDAYLFVPSNNTKGLKGAVGAEALSVYQPRLNPSVDLPGSLLDVDGSPFAIRDFDGGLKDATLGTRLNMESFTITGKSGGGLLGLLPKFNGSATEPYTLLVTDYSNTYCDADALTPAPECPVNYIGGQTPGLDVENYPAVRIWGKGKLLQYTESVACDAGQDFWKALTFYNKSGVLDVTSYNTCGNINTTDGTNFGILPYAIP